MLSLLRSTAATTAVLTALSVGGPSIAEEATGKDFAELVEKLGPQAVRLWRQDTEVAIQPSQLSAEKRNQAVEMMLQDYSKLRSSYASATNAADWTSLGVTGGAGLAILLAGPQATITVPAILISAAITTTIDIGNEELEKLASSEARKLLRDRRDKIVEATGFTYEQLHADPEKVRAAFADNVDIFKDVRDQAGGNTEQWRNSQEMLIDMIANTTATQLEAIDVNAAEIDELGANFAKISEKVLQLETEFDERLTEVEDAVANISDAVVGLQGAVVNLDTRVASLETDQAIISDFVLDSMSAEQKVRAIRDQGFLKDRFRCEDGQASCAASELKDSLIKRFEKEAELENLLEDVAIITGAMNDIHSIATNLGIDSGPLNEAVAIGNVAAATFTNFATGNYLGALSSATSLFAKKKDPDAERFKILMRYLDRQFKQVNAKLDRIIENQIKIVEVLGQLSEQMKAGFERNDRALQRLEFEQQRMSLGVRSLIWDDWKSCNAVYSRSTERDDATGGYKFIDPSTLYFRSEDVLKQIVRTQGETAILPCLETLQGELASLNAVERFGNFIDINWVLGNDRLQSNVPAFKVEADEWRTILETYELSVFSPSKALFAELLETQPDLGSASLFAGLARPSVSTDDWDTTVELLANEPFECWQADHSEARLFSLLCRGGTGIANENALSLLQRPILADVVNDIAQWIMVVSHFADLRDQENEEWLFVEDLLRLAAEGQLDAGESAGEILISQSIGVLDLAIASYGMIYGGLPGQALDNKVASSGVDEWVIKSLDANPFLAHNFLMFFLERRYQQEFPNADSKRPSITAYRRAYELAESTEKGKHLLFGSLFGTDLRFVNDDRGAPSLRLMTQSSEVIIPMPAPSAFSEGRLTLPTRYFELLATREQLVDRLYSYNIIDGLPEEAKAAMALSLTQ